jgi:small subunit ribosomal protein S4
MGDPRRCKNKAARPKKLWDKARIEEESRLKKEYGLKNMRELWIAAAELKKVRTQARNLLSLTKEERAEKEQKLMAKLNRLGILPEHAELEDVLSISVKDFLERRLQTVVFRKGLAKTIKQSRQLITHGFIAIDGRRVDVPSYLVRKEEEDKISYYKPITISPSAQEEKEGNHEQ